MKTETANTVVGICMIPLGLLGLLIASRALDAEMSVFGYGLILFAALFGFSLIKDHYDRLEAAPARMPGADHE